MNRANLYDPLPLESEPVRKIDAPGADKVEKNEWDPLPLGPFQKKRKNFRVGDVFREEISGELATVVSVEKGKVSYTFKGGEGVLLNV